MPPGRRATARSTQPEAPITEYEKLRANNLIRNNQLLQRLGVTTIASIFNNTSATRRGDAGEESGSLYDVQEGDDSGDEEVDQVTKDLRKNSSNTQVNASSRRAIASKRVLAPERQAEPTRVTRQKTKSLALAMSSEQQVQTEDFTTTPTPQPEEVDMRDEGALEESRRNISMGRELDRISRGLGTKIPIHVKDGKRRPEAPMQAAKLASEGGIILRQHMPIFTHWKEYKKEKNKEHIENYIGKVAANFTMDTKSNAIRAACTDLLKGGQRQRRYILKKKYFNNTPANQVRTTSPVGHITDDQWKELVKMWSEPKHKEKSEKAKLSRGNVQLHQRTGSRCYIAQAHVVKTETFKDVEPTPVDLFKNFHCGKNGFSEPVQKAIDDMEAIMDEPIQDGQESKSANEAVSQVVKSTTFLNVAGVRSASKNISRGPISSQVQDLQAELANEKQEKAELRQELDNLKMQAQESETSRVKQSEEIEALKKTSQEMHALLRQMLSFNQDHRN